MTLSGKPSTLETCSTPPQRAGLRVAPASDQPTGVFVVIEMAVLVLVTALAMVSIIVASGEDDAQRANTPSANVERHAPAQRNAVDDPQPSYRTVDTRGSVVGSAGQ